MKTEIEAKFLDIDSATIRAELEKLGASLVFPESLTRQKVFDFPDFKLDRDYSWLRFREENGQVTLTLKKWRKEGVDGMGEIAFEAESFEETEQPLLAIELKVKSSQMKKRELWKLGDTEFMIDTWPWIPPFLEIEGKIEQDVREAASHLNLERQRAMFGGVVRIYKRYFNIEYEEIDRCPEIAFSPVSEWLERKRIK